MVAHLLALFIVVFQEEIVSLVDYEAAEFRQIKLAAGSQTCVELAQRRDYNMAALEFARQVIAYLDVRELAEGFVYCSGLINELSHRTYHNYLGLGDLRVDSEDGTDREGSSLSRAILALGYQVLVDPVFVWLGDHRYRHVLDLRWLREPILTDTLLKVVRNLYVIFVVPRHLLANEWTCQVLREFVGHKLHLFLPFIESGRLFWRLV